MSDLTQMLQAYAAGEPTAGEGFFAQVYNELRKIAAAHLSREQPGQTLQPTALVHEVYLRLIANQQSPQWKGQAHFFAAASIAIRHILIDNARKKRSQKHGGGNVKLPLADNVAVIPGVHEDLLALDEALQKLTQQHPEAAEVVQLTYFGGLTLPETAACLGVSPRTVGRLWSFARAWLRREIEGPEANSQNS